MYIIYSYIYIYYIYIYPENDTSTNQKSQSILVISCDFYLSTNRNRDFGRQVSLKTPYDTFAVRSPGGGSSHCPRGVILASWKSLARRKWIYHDFSHLLTQQVPPSCWFIKSINYSYIYIQYGFMGDRTTGWWFGTFFIFPYIGSFMIPTDFHIFQRG